MKINVRMRPNQRLRSSTGSLEKPTGPKYSSRTAEDVSHVVWLDGHTLRGAGAAHGAALFFCHPAPYARVLRGFERPLQARLADGAHLADCLRGRDLGK